MSFSSQLLGHEGGSDTSLDARGGCLKVKCTNKRADAIRFLLSGFQGKELRRLADISSKLFSEINYGWNSNSFRSAM